MQRKDFALKIKSVDDTAGTFVGLAAVYNNVDLGSDVIDPGAFTRTLSTGKSFPILWQHQPDNPIGTAKITDTREGLQVNGILMLSDPTAQKAYTFMKAGVVKGLSIGYDTIQATYDGDIRHLTELRLWEISCVTFPMNESALVSGVKSLSDDELQMHLKAICIAEKGIRMHTKSLRMHLKAVLGADADDIFDDEDGSQADDPAFLEGNDSEPGGASPADDEMSKAFLIELRKLANEAQELASA